MWQKCWLIKRKKRLAPLTFDSPPFRLPYLFLNFNHLPINSDLETSKKELCSHDTNTKLTALNRYSISLEKRDNWPNFFISVSPAFIRSVAMCHAEENSPHLSGAQLRSLKSAKRDSWSSKQENSMNYILHLLHFLLQRVLLLSQPTSCIY